LEGVVGRSIVIVIVAISIVIIIIITSPAPLVVTVRYHHQQSIIIAIIIISIEMVILFRPGVLPVHVEDSEVGSRHTRTKAYQNRNVGPNPGERRDGG
jgi:hypothetical protein